jgi:hypothetical protein
MEETDSKTAPPREPKGKTVYLAGGEVDKTSVSLRFFGDTLDPDEISNLLDCRPTHSYRSGLYMKSWNREIDFSPELMAQISARGLTLSLDIYYVETRLIPVEPNFLNPLPNLDD